MSKRHRPEFRCAAAALLLGLLPASGAAAQMEAEAGPQPEIVLPLKLVAGFPATLATLGADRKLASHVAVVLGNGVQIETDATGRADFPAPAAGVLIARAGNAAAAALVETSPGPPAPRRLSVARFAAVHGSFDVCGGGFRGDAEEDRVLINNQPGLVLASSPECLVIISDPKIPPGPAVISVESPRPPRRSTITLIAIEFEAPEPPLKPGQEGWLTVRARGSEQKLRVSIENQSPDVLRFERGDAQEVTTRGGTQNVAKIEVRAIRSGDFSIRAQLASRPDPEAARRFIEAAQPLAMADQVQALKEVENDLRHHPQKARAELSRMLAAATAADLRALLAAAVSLL
ncbi:MAG TPA: hypothetical protein VEJ67_02220 [Candidatus Cybelea sp.]|nr:hypothetical protein [Candidatus Cybelea sp.]